MERTIPDYRALYVLLQHLPKNATWTTTRRKTWLEAMVYAVDLLVQIDDESSEAPEKEGE